MLRNTITTSWKWQKPFWLFLLLSIFFACQPKVVLQDEQRAAQVARQFILSAFMTQDWQSSYSLLQPKLQRKWSKETLREMVDSMHPNFRPSLVKINEYVSTPDGVSLYAFGEHEGEKFYYLLQMVGSASSGYTIGGMSRKSEPFETERERQELSVPVIIAYRIPTV